MSSASVVPVNRRHKAGDRPCVWELLAEFKGPVRRATVETNNRGRYRVTRYAAPHVFPLVDDFALRLPLGREHENRDRAFALAKSVL